LVVTGNAGWGVEREDDVGGRISIGFSRASIVLPTISIERQLPPSSMPFDKQTFVYKQAECPIECDVYTPKGDYPVFPDGQPVLIFWLARHAFISALKRAPC
jgi:hypothetical protein